MAGSVDVLIPCYNYGRYLEACVRSVLDGAQRPVRVLIIDDASTDDTPAIGRALATRYQNVSYCRHEKNLGHHSTYNEGIAWAAGDYFVLLSADDLLVPGALDRAAAFFDEHPEVGLVHGRTLMFHDIVPDVSLPGTCRSEVVDGVDFIRASFASGHTPVSSPASVMIRTTLQQEIGGYLAELPHSGDLEMYLRCAARMAIGVLDVPQGLYRQHSANMSRGFRHVRNYAQLLAAFETICRTCGDRVPDHKALLRGVKRTLATEMVWTASRAFDLAGPAEEFNLEEYLSFAAAMDPSVRHRRAWRFLQFKRLLGRPWSRRIAWCLHAVRFLSDRQPA